MKSYSRNQSVELNFDKKKSLILHSALISGAGLWFYLRKGIGGRRGGGYERYFYLIFHIKYKEKKTDINSYIVDCKFTAGCLT